MAIYLINYNVGTLFRETTQLTDKKVTQTHLHFKTNQAYFPISHKHKFSILNMIKICNYFI